jgi:transposase
MSQGTTRRKFTKEFKREAVRLSHQPDVCVSQVVRNLGIDVKELYRWRAEMKETPAEAFPGKGRRRTSAAEVERLRREVEQLKMEREILKKATAFFASPLLGGTRS